MRRVCLLPSPVVFESNGSYLVDGYKQKNGIRGIIKIEHESGSLVLWTTPTWRCIERGYTNKLCFLESAAARARSIVNVASEPKRDLNGLTMAFRENILSALGACIDLPI
jgi:hypothetical protein